MVLGDGARDRGATCELIPADPSTGAGVAFVRLEPDPDPVRVRAGWVTAPTSATWPPGDLRSRRVAGGGGMTTVTAWRTDEPCPVCATGLIIADELSRQAAEQLGRSKTKPSGTQRARRRRTAS